MNVVAVVVPVVYVVTGVEATPDPYEAPDVVPTEYSLDEGNVMMLVYILVYKNIEMQGMTYTDLEDRVFNADGAFSFEFKCLSRP